MKKILVFTVMACVLAGSVLAQSGSQASYTVQSVTGRVQREAGNARVDVKIGDILTSDAVVHTGVGASLVLREGEKSFTIPPVRSGRIGDLVVAGTGMRISGNVSRVETGAAARATTQVATASARAADAAEDDDIAAE